MASPAACLFPTTEAWKQTTEILNSELPENQLSGIAQSAVQSLLGMKPQAAAEPAARIAFSAFVFVFRQLVFHGHASTGDELLKALSEAVLVGKLSVALKKSVVDVIATEWASHSKTLTQNARQATIEELCRHGSNGESSLISVTTDIEMGVGAVLEDDAAQDGLKYFVETTHHAPRAKVLLPPSELFVSGAQLCLGKEEAYRFFVEIDSIQRAIDSLLGHTAAA